MEDLLKRLLEAEARAEAEVEKASAEREHAIQDAVAQVRRAEEQFESGIGELRQPYLAQAEERAAQAIAELKRKYAERQARLRSLAEERERDAVEAALQVILDPDR